MLLSFPKIVDFAPQIIKIGSSFFGNQTKLFMDNLLRGDLRYWLFAQFREGRPIGFLILSVVEREAEIIQIAVAKDFHSQGNGKKLIKEAVDFCNSQKIAKLFLEVRASNSAALKLYSKAGFRQISVRKGYYSNPVEDALIFLHLFNQ